MNVHNVAQLLLSRCEDSPGTRLGLAGSPMTVAEAVGKAGDLARALLDRGLEPGRPVALVGANSNDWLIGWMACQLAALPTALINPSFPDDLLIDVLRPLAPQAVLTTDPRIAPSGLADRWIGTQDLKPRGNESGPLPGVDASATDLSAFMLTSGTSGPPKLVAQSHRYFLSLGRYVADTMGMTEADTVLTPLPLFHINPLGYAVLGALTARADCLSLPRFSASTFWTQVRDTAATVAILHSPPLEILKRRTTRADAGKHSLRAVLYADPAFLTTFDIPLAVTVYGSTEVGGLSHTHLWRRDDTAEPPEGAVHYGGHHRPGLVHRISDEGEIHVRALEPGLLAEGYVRPGGVVESFLRDGWFATGDLGYEDDGGRLVYLSRASESVCVKGEFVPLGFVEDTFRKIGSIHDLALWKRPSSLVGEELVLFITAPAVPVEEIRRTAADLPGFMRPSAIARMTTLPRDTTIGKTRRRELHIGNAIEVVEL